MRTTAFLSAIIVAVFVSGCSTGPSVIEGSVVMRTATEAHIDLGHDDGLQIGDRLTVWREERGSSQSHRTVRVGMVRVRKILDARHSVVETLTGNLRERDRVEKLIRSSQ